MNRLTCLSTCFLLVLVFVSLSCDHRVERFILVGIKNQTERPLHIYLVKQGTSNKEQTLKETMLDTNRFKGFYYSNKSIISLSIIPWTNFEELWKCNHCQALYQEIMYQADMIPNLIPLPSLIYFYNDSVNVSAARLLQNKFSDIVIVIRPENDKNEIPGDTLRFSCDAQPKGYQKNMFLSDHWTKAFKGFEKEYTLNPFASGGDIHPLENYWHVFIIRNEEVVK